MVTTAAQTERRCNAVAHQRINKIGARDINGIGQTVDFNFIRVEPLNVPRIINVVCRHFAQIKFFRKIAFQ